MEAAKKSHRGIQVNQTTYPGGGPANPGAEAKGIPGGKPGGRKPGGGPGIPGGNDIGGAMDGAPTEKSQHRNGTKRCYNLKAH